MATHLKQVMCRPLCCLLCKPRPCTQALRLSLLAQFCDESALWSGDLPVQTCPQGETSNPALQRGNSSHLQHSLRLLVVNRLAGRKRLEAMLGDAAAHGQSSSTASISGAAAFELYDTYGYPLELTQELAAEKDVSVSFFRNALSSHPRTSPVCGASRRQKSCQPSTVVA